LLDVLQGQNIGGGPWTILGSEYRWRHLMAFVFGVNMAGESDDDPEPTGSLPS
jgi:hypothetical protein